MTKKEATNFLNAKPYIKGVSYSGKNQIFHFSIGGLSKSVKLSTIEKIQSQPSAKQDFSLRYGGNQKHRNA